MPTRPKPLSSYWNGWNPSDQRAYDAFNRESAAKGVEPTVLIDEPEEFRDLDDYCKQLLDNMVKQTNAAPKTARVFANVENIWPRIPGTKIPDYKNLPEIRRVAFALIGVFFDWRSTCGKREGGYGEFGLYVSDKFGWGDPSNGVYERNKVVAYALRPYVNSISVEAYFAASSHPPYRILGVEERGDGDPVKFLCQAAYHDCRMAAALWGNTVNLWVGEDVYGSPTPLSVEPYQLGNVVRWAYSGMGAGVCSQVVHFKGWDEKTGKAKPVTPGDGRYVDAVVGAARG